MLFFINLGRLTLTKPALGPGEGKAKVDEQPGLLVDEQPGLLGALRMPVAMQGGLEDAGGKLEDLGDASGGQLQGEGQEGTVTVWEGSESIS